MPTVCASVPMHAPATRIFRPIRSRDERVDLVHRHRVRAPEGAAMLSTSTLCAVLRVEHEKRKTRSDPAAVDDLHVAKPILPQADAPLRRRPRSIRPAA